MDNPAARVFSIEYLASDCVDPEVGFDRAVRLAIWWVIEGRAETSLENDLLGFLKKGGICWHLFIIYMAFEEPKFYRLANILAANTELKNTSVSPGIREFMVRLRLVDSPEVGKSTIGRDVCLVLAMAFGTRLGWYPTHGQSRPSSNKQLSSSMQIAGRFTSVGVNPPSDRSLEGIWKDRAEKVLRVGLEPKHLSENFVKNVRVRS